MSDFNFVDELPPIRRRDTVLDDFAKALRDNPERWAEYPKEIKRQAMYAQATLINRQDAKTPMRFRGGFEAVTRDGALYVRYVGERISD